MRAAARTVSNLTLTFEPNYSIADGERNERVSPEMLNVGEQD